MTWKDPATGKEHNFYHTKDFEGDLTTWTASHCKHPKTELRWWLDASKRRALRHQCRLCGAPVGPARPQAEALPSTPNFDTEKHVRYEQARQDAYNAIFRKHVAIQEQEETDFRREHAKYLLSDTWKAKRAKVLERAKGICEGCLERPATQVHHITYDHWQDELLFELVAICRDCHVKAHANDKDGAVEGDD